MIYYKSSFKGILLTVPAWTWRELQYGCKKDIIPCADVVSYAMRIVDEETALFDEVLKFILAEEEEAMIILDVLAEAEKDQREEEIREKWLFAILRYANLKYPSQVFTIIEEVYDDFGFPKSLAPLVYYMPYDGGGPLSEKLKKFISDGEEKYIGGVPNVSRGRFC